MCYVLGHESNRMFSVEIAATKNVAQLRSVIKAEGSEALQHINAASLTLWAVSFPDDHTTSFNELSLGDKEPLRPAQVLCKVFPPGLAQGHIHIVIRIPHRGRYRFFYTPLSLLFVSSFVRVLLTICSQSALYS